MWDKYSSTLPSSAIIQLLFVFNVLTILLYQWPFKAFDCQFSEFAKLFVSSFLIQKTSPLPIHKEEPDKNRYSFLLLMRCLTLRELQFVNYVTRISRAKLVHKFLNCSNVFALRKYLTPEIILPKRARDHPSPKFSAAIRALSLLNSATTAKFLIDELLIFALENQAAGRRFLADLIRACLSGREQKIYCHRFCYRGVSIPK